MTISDCTGCDDNAKVTRAHNAWESARVESAARLRALAAAEELESRCWTAYWKAIEWDAAN